MTAILGRTNSWLMMVCCTFALVSLVSTVPVRRDSNGDIVVAEDIDYHNHNQPANTLVTQSSTTPVTATTRTARVTKLAKMGRNAARAPVGKNAGSNSRAEIGSSNARSQRHSTESGHETELRQNGITDANAFTQAFVVTLAEYVGKKYRHLAEQYARMVLNPQARNNEIDVLDLSFLTEATKFLRHSMLPVAKGYPFGARRPVERMDLTELKAALARRAQNYELESEFDALLHADIGLDADFIDRPPTTNGDADFDADILVEGDNEENVTAAAAAEVTPAGSNAVRFRGLANMLPHMCKLDKFKQLKQCRMSSS